MKVGKTELVKDFKSNTESKWIPGEIVTRTSPVTYDVKVERDRVIRRHSNQIIRRSSLSLPTATDQVTATSTNRKSIGINHDEQENIVNKSQLEVQNRILDNPEQNVGNSSNEVENVSRYNLRSRNV